MVHNQDQISETSIPLILIRQLPSHLMLPIRRTHQIEPIPDIPSRPIRQLLVQPTVHLRKSQQLTSYPTHWPDHYTLNPHRRSQTPANTLSSSASPQPTYWLVQGPTQGCSTRAFRVMAIFGQSAV